MLKHYSAICLEWLMKKRKNSFGIEYCIKFLNKEYPNYEARMLIMQTK
jgi:hypothetical protein